MTLLVHVEGVEFDDPIASQRMKFAGVVYAVLDKDFDIRPDWIKVSSAMDAPRFVVLNESPMPGIRRPVVTGPGNDLDFYADEGEALARRDELREEADNPDIVVREVAFGKVVER